MVVPVSAVLLSGTDGELVEVGLPFRGPCTGVQRRSFFVFVVGVARCVPAFLSKIAEAIGMCRLVGGRIQLDVPAVVLAALGEHSPCRLELGALPRPTVCSALAHPELRLRVSSPAQVKACVRWSSLRFGFEGDGRVCGRRRC